MYRLAAAAALLLAAVPAAPATAPAAAPATAPAPAPGHVPAAAVPCEEAKLRCAWRSGCGAALQNYVVGCSAVLARSAAACPEVCQHALIALTSTEQGADLMTCDCQQDAVCLETKARTEVCRPQVTRATRNESIVGCRVAEWICSADGVCSTALDYYHRYCRSMFQGKKCSNRCKNSISILRRQEKAAKLATCVCDGREGYDCARIRANMDRLCYRREAGPPQQPPPPTPPPARPPAPDDAAPDAAAAACPAAALLLAMAVSASLT